MYPVTVQRCTFEGIWHQEVHHQYLVLKILNTPLGFVDEFYLAPSSDISIALKKTSTTRTVGFTFRLGNERFALDWLCHNRLQVTSWLHYVGDHQ